MYACARLTMRVESRGRDEGDESKSGCCSDLASFDKLLRLSQGMVATAVYFIYLFIYLFEKRKAINNFLLLVRQKRKLVSCDDVRA
jgi:hypothetical protein